MIELNELLGFIEEIRALRLHMDRASEGLLTAQETLESSLSDGGEGRTRFLSRRKETLAMFAMMTVSSTLVRVARRISLLMDTIDVADIRIDPEAVSESLLERE